MADVNDPVSASNSDGMAEADKQMLSPAEIYYLLLADLKDINELVEKAKIHANENQHTQSWGSCMSAHRSGPHAKDLQSLYKMNAMEALVKNSDVKPFGEPLYSARAQLELRAKLLERIKKDRECLAHLSTQLASLQEAKKDVSRRTEELKKITGNRSISGEMKTVVRWQEVADKVKYQRAKFVKDIRHVTEELCPNSDIPDILSNALKQSSTGNDPYIRVEDPLSQDVEFLLRCNIISRHPHDRKLIRLRELV